MVGPRGAAFVICGLSTAIMAARARIRVRRLFRTSGFHARRRDRNPDGAAAFDRALQEARHATHFGSIRPDCSLAPRSSPWANRSLLSSLSPVRRAASAHAATDDSTLVLDSRSDAASMRKLTAISISQPQFSQDQT